MEETNKLEAPEMVDLGLPSGLKWAKWNVGATKETEYGKLFAWGDVTGSEATDRECDGKYTEDWYVAQGLTAITSNLTLEQDAAHVAYVGNYRMPTKAEFEELSANTEMTVETVNGVSGTKFTASNGNYIFFPFLGYGLSGSIRNYGYSTYVWLSSYKDDGGYAWCFGCNGCRCDLLSNYHYSGFSVRAVCSSNEDNIDKLESSSSLNEDEDKAIYEAERDICLRIDEIVEKMKELLYSDISDLVMRTWTTAKMYYDRKYDRLDADDDNSPEMVDLGLPSGLKWAKWNVGATNETEYGKLFAWGDTIGSDATKDGCARKYYKDWYAEQGLAAIGSNLKLAQDAANVAYGRNYRMPTNEEIKELIANTKYSKVTINGVKGGKFTAPNGNYIFFPFAGYGVYGSIGIQGDEACIWSSSYGRGDNSWYLYCYGNSYCTDKDFRYYGYSVRAVVG